MNIRTHQNKLQQFLPQIRPGGPPSQGGNQQNSRKPPQKCNSGKPTSPCTVPLLTRHYPFVGDCQSRFECPELLLVNLAPAGFRRVTSSAFSNKQEALQVTRTRSRSKILLQLPDFPAQPRARRSPTVPAPRNSVKFDQEEYERGFAPDSRHPAHLTQANRLHAQPDQNPMLPCMQPTQEGNDCGTHKACSQADELGIEAKRKDPLPPSMQGRGFRH